MSAAVKFWRVGELAKHTGVSVRTLHHYNEIGLLVPSDRSKSGYRLYSPSDIERLQIIKSLQQLGLSLQEILTSIDQPGFSLLNVIPRQVQQLREQIQVTQNLCERLEQMEKYLQQRKDVSPEESLQLIYLMTIMENYYTPEQMKIIEEQGKLHGPKKIKEVEAEWPKLIAAVKAEMEKGTDPSDSKVQAYAKRWMELVQMFTGGDPGVEQSLKKMYQHEQPKLQAVHGAGVPDLKMMDYINKAMESAKKK